MHQQATPASDVRQGLLDIVPVVISALPIGILFGALAVGKGLSVAEVGLMSLLVFAGGAQFAAVELWTWPVPILALVFSTLLINSRHILMGASLGPKLRGFSLVQRLFGAHLLIDEGWALAERRALTRPITPTYWLALTGTLPLVWTGSSLLGAWLGSFLGDPARFGADFAFPAIFIGLVAGFWKGPRSIFPIALSAVGSALVYIAVGPPWHVAAGAFAGIAAAYLVAEPEERAP